MRNYQRALKFDFTLIADAQSFYTRNGFKDIAVPWVIDQKYVAETKPDNVEFYATLGGVLVASAEQSFMQMLDKGWNKPGAYQATTPCFRDEDHDDLHSPYFMKTELFDNETVSVDRLHEIIDLSLYFFNSLTEARVEEIGDGSFDIVGKKSGLELGSYGIRERHGNTWIYGTGIALPRFQQVYEKELNM